MRSILSLALTAGLASAAVHQVSVGAGGLKFSPDSITADVGDVVEFKFGAGHSVTQGPFGSPCAPGGSPGFFSSIVLDTSKVFRVTITSTDPLWYYCSQVGHCQAGMVGVINPPSNANTLAAYRSAAAGTSGSSDPGSIQGGELVAAGSPIEGATTTTTVATTTTTTAGKPPATTTTTTTAAAATTTTEDESHETYTTSYKTTSTDDDDEYYSTTLSYSTTTVAAVTGANNGTVTTSAPAAPATQTTNAANTMVPEKMAGLFAGFLAIMGAALF